MLAPIQNIEVSLEILPAKLGNVCFLLNERKLSTLLFKSILTKYLYNVC